MSEKLQWTHVDIDRPPYGVLVFICRASALLGDNMIETARLTEDGCWVSQFGSFISRDLRPTWWMAMPRHPEIDAIIRRDDRRKEENERAVYERLKAKFREAQ